MQCFTPEECSEWLAKNGITEQPYAQELPMLLQLEPPGNARRLAAFIRQVFELCGSYPWALVQFTDWNSENPDEMAMMASLRRSHGEQRVLIEAPCHKFSAAEAGEATGHCWLAASLGWSAYLYLGKSGTFYFWEGDLIDFWSYDKNFIKEVDELVERFKLRVTVKNNWPWVK